MKAVSLIFHPLMMPSFTCLLVTLVLPELVYPMGWMMLPFLFITTFLIPLFGISALRFTGNISSFAIEKREERFLPFLFVSIFYGITTFMFIFKVQINNTIGLMLLATTVLIVLLMMVTLFYKISIHAAGMSGVVGFLLVLTLSHPGSNVIYVLLPSLILTGLVLTSRLYLNVHTPREILFGTLLGLITCFGALWIFD